MIVHHPERNTIVKKIFIFTFSFLVISLSIHAQEHADYKVPKKLDAEDFQLPESKKLIEKFNVV